MADREPYKWITVKGHHVPVYKDEHGDDVFGNAMPAPKDRKELLDLFIPESDFTRQEEYQELSKRWSEIIDEDRQNAERRKELSKQLDKESSPKPKEEWTTDDEITAMLGLGKPKTYTEKGKQLKEEFDSLFKRSQELDKQLTKINDAQEDLKQHQHFKEVTAWENDMRVLKGGTHNFTKGSRDKDYVGFQTKTGMSDYDRKDAPGFIAEMSPREYLQRITYQSFGSTWGRVLQSVDAKNVMKYVDMMASGVKFDMPSMTVGEAKQEGRHRAMAAMLLGIKTIPVYVEYPRKRG